MLPLDYLEPLTRNQLLSIGSLALALSTFLVILVWVSRGSSSLEDSFTVGAKVNAFLAITLLALNFVLTTRLRLLERAFQGLDRLYKVHKLVGKLVLTFAFLHLLFLVFKQLPSGDVWEYLIPGLEWTATLGILSFVFLFVLLLLTLVFRPPYHLWHMGHRLMFIPLLLATLHSLLAGSDLAKYPVLRFLVIGICVLGLISYIYTLVLYRYLGPRYSAEIIGVSRMEGLTELELRSDPPMGFHAGQFLFVRFPRFVRVHEMFPFSISNAPGEGTIRISAKKAGDFTSDILPTVKKGDKAVIMGPYGKFGERFLAHRKDMIWVAGGIGITPFLSMAKQETKEPTGRRIDLVWSVRDLKDAIYNGDLSNEASANEDLHHHLWLSGERGRLTGSDIESMIGGRDDLRRRVIFLCGPTAMMKGIATQLIHLGAHPRNIIFEDFNLL